MQINCMMCHYKAVKTNVFCTNSSFNKSWIVFVTSLPSALVVLCCGWFGNMNGLFESPSQVNGALLDHLSDVLDPVLLVLNAGRLLLVNDEGGARGQRLELSGNQIPLEFLFHSLCFTQVWICLLSPLIKCKFTGEGIFQIHFYFIWAPSSCGPLEQWSQPRLSDVPPQPCQMNSSNPPLIALVMFQMCLFELIVKTGLIYYL